MAERKMVSVQEIAGIYPVKDADRIEKAKVLGWIVVVGKDMGLKPGDHVAYFEVDCLLPADDPRYAAFQKRGVKTLIVEDPNTGKDVEVSGHVLRTVRLRGTYSQGLIMPLSELGIDPETPVGADVTREAGVYKYEELPPLRGGDMIGPFGSAYASKSDAPRLQNLTDVWSELVGLRATPTVKVDGTSTTIARDDNGIAHVYSRNWEIKPECTNMVVAQRDGLVDALEPGMAIQFELVGLGIQSNRLKLRRPTPFVFAVWRNHRKINRSDWPQACLNHAVPVLDAARWRLEGSVEDMVAKVDGLRGCVTDGVLDEGIVWHLDADQLLSSDVAGRLSANRCFKIINNKYLLKHGL
ncbi:RNA ligase family protein [Bifidobacterium oedipodis]|uniref:2'-5' RNA ligase n=1 Tax=Bifidobacterium oedipodis TaxID=2675322 RepID=A0A7Y0HUF3_9BIFI|nr:RNA ligase family protein [Bifidobacterium sp. DSM 109957]NMM94699.1 2'-5' RNA ligase [Bifidobacterium sp. DSM 109957]